MVVGALGQAAIRREFLQPFGGPKGEGRDQ